MREGHFCWDDYGTPELKKARDYYAKIFGWTYNEKPKVEGRAYSVASSHQSPAVGLFDGKKRHWNSYIAVKDIKKTTKKAQELGAQILLEPSAFDGGIMSKFKDPSGAVVSLWQNDSKNDAQSGEKTKSAKNTEGRVCWRELVTHDAGKAAAFYSKLLGWKAETMKQPGMDYTTFSKDGVHVAGMMQLDKNMAKVVPNWLLYFNVHDLKAATKKATDAGAKVLMGPQKVEKTGTFSVIQSPNGVSCGILEPPKP